MLYQYLGIRYIQVIQNSLRVSINSDVTMFIEFVLKCIK